MNQRDDEAAAIRADVAEAARRDATMVANARRRHGAAGALLAAGMLAVDEALGRKPREEAPIVIAAADEPTDIDADGIVLAVDESTSVVAPPQPRVDPFAPKRRRKARSKS